MQKVACDANAIKKLSEIILKTKSPPTSARHEDLSTHHADKLKEVRNYVVLANVVCSLGHRCNYVIQGRL
jgi:hypothetical protein